MHLQRITTVGLMAAGLSCQPVFGCRLEGVMGPAQTAPNVQAEQDQFTRSTLLTAPDSLRREAMTRPPKNNDFDIEDLSGVLRPRGNPDGWGIAEYPAPLTGARQPVISKSMLPAFSDPNYAVAISQTIKQKPNILLAHIRLASPECKDIQLSNVHPFTYQNWSFIHNGTVTGAFSPMAEEKINRYRSVLGGGPKGTTDSERVFYYFLARLYETAGTTDSRKIPLPQLQTVFARSVTELMAASAHPSKPVSHDVMGMQGDIQMQPACNFMLSDGEHLLAFKKVFNLYLGEKTLSNRQKVYIVASEERHSDPRVKWLNLPEDHILTIAWDAQGNPIPSLEPLSKLAPVSPSPDFSPLPALSPQSMSAPSPLPMLPVR